MKVLFASMFLCGALVLSSVSLAGDSAKKDDSKAAKPVNKICPVEKGEVDPEVTIQHEGKTIGFCCAGCDEEFKKDPAKYMAIVEKELKESKDDGKGKKDKKKAELNAKCPVTDDDADKTMTHEHKGRTIAFCCEGCIDDFKADPKKYLAKLDQAEKDAAKKDKSEK